MGLENCLGICRWPLNCKTRFQNMSSFKLPSNFRYSLFFSGSIPLFVNFGFTFLNWFSSSSSSNKGKTHVANVNVKAIVNGTSLMTNFKISKIDLVDLIVNEKEKEKAFVNTKKKQKVKLEYMCYKISLGWTSW